MTTLRSIGIHRARTEIRSYTEGLFMPTTPRQNTDVRSKISRPKKALGRLLCWMLCLTGLLMAEAAAAQDWPMWRGPEQNGRAEAPGTFEGSPKLRIAWTRPLGTGYSSVSVVGDRAVTLFGDGETDILIALDAEDGREVWRVPLGATYRGHSGSQDGPIGTPTIADGVVYAVGPRGKLAAVKLDTGEIVWTRDLPSDLGAKPPFYGFSTSPMPVGDVLLVQVGGSEGRSLCGLDKATGELRWKAGEDSVSHQLPLLIDVEGKRQWLSVTDTQLTGVAPDSGQILWTHQHSPKPQYVPTYPQAVLVGEDHLLLAFEKQAELFEMVAIEGEVFLGEVWRSASLKDTEAVPIVDGGHLYGFNGKFLTCVERATGREVWKSRPPGGRGLIWVDGHLVVFAPSGELVVVEATPEAYREVTRIPVAEDGGLTPPSFAHGRLFVRNQKIAAAIEIASSAQESAAPPAPVSSSSDGR